MGEDWRSEGIRLDRPCDSWTLSLHERETRGRLPRNRRIRLGDSAKARASLKLQGRYMGYMRQLKPAQKAQVRKIKQTKGVRAAIARARQLAEQRG